MQYSNNQWMEFGRTELQYGTGVALDHARNMDSFNKSKTKKK